MSDDLNRRDATISTLKRILISLVSCLLAIGVCGVALTIYGFTRQPGELRDFPIMFLYVISIMIGLGYRAWIVALPAVLLLTNFRTWRFWALLALGTTIGPLTLYLQLVRPFRGNRAMVFGDTHDLFVCLGAAILSGLSTLTYLLIAQRLRLATQH